MAHPLMRAGQRFVASAFHGRAEVVENASGRAVVCGCRGQAGRDVRGVLAGDLTAGEEDARGRLLNSQENRRSRLTRAVQQPGYRCVLGQVLPQQGRGALVETAQVEKELLRLVPDGAQGNRQRRSAFGQGTLQIFQVAAVEEDLDAQMGDHIKGIGGAGGYQTGQLPRAAGLAAARFGLSADGLARLKPPVPETDHSPPERLEHHPGSRGIFVRGIEIQAESVRHVRSPLELLGR